MTSLEFRKCKFEVRISSTRLYLNVGPTGIYKIEIILSREYGTALTLKSTLIAHVNHIETYLVLSFSKNLLNVHI